MQTPIMSTFSARRFSVRLCSSLWWFPFNRRRQAIHRVYYGLRSRLTHQGLSPTTQAVPYMGHRRHFPGRVFRRCQGLHACAQGGMPGHFARPAPSIATVITHLEEKERSRGKWRARKSRTGGPSLITPNTFCCRCFQALGANCNLNAFSNPIPSWEAGVR